MFVNYHDKGLLVAEMSQLQVSIHKYINTGYNIGHLCAYKKLKLLEASLQ